MKIRCKGVELNLTPDMIEAVLRQYAAEHPGCENAMRELTEDEFANRMRAAIIASARIVP